MKDWRVTKFLQNVGRLRSTGHIKQVLSLLATVINVTDMTSSQVEKLDTQKQMEGQNNQAHTLN